MLRRKEGEVKGSKIEIQKEEVQRREKRRVKG